MIFCDRVYTLNWHCCCNQRKHCATPIHQFPCETKHVKIIILLTELKGRQHFYQIEAIKQDRNIPWRSVQWFLPIFRRPKFISFRSILFSMFLLLFLLLLAEAIRFYDCVWVFSYAHQFPRRVLLHRPYLVLDLRKLRVCLHFNWHTSSERTCALHRFYTLRISFQWNSYVYSLFHWNTRNLSVGLSSYRIANQERK